MPLGPHGSEVDPNMHIASFEIYQTTFICDIFDKLSGIGVNRWTGITWTDRRRQTDMEVRMVNHILCRVDFTT